MSLSDWKIKPSSRRRGVAPAQAPAAPAPAAPTQVLPAAPPRAEAERWATEELRGRRDVVARRFAELQWDLGGVVYEMASRDHFRLDVLTMQAAKLQEADAELAEIERMLHLQEAAAAGSCPSCGALYARGAAFCWSCGTTLIEPASPAPDATATAEVSS